MEKGKSPVHYDSIVKVATKAIETLSY